MNSCELTASVTAVANLLAKNMNASETSLLAAVIVQLGIRWQRLRYKNHYVKTNKIAFCWSGRRLFYLRYISL